MAHCIEATCSNCGASRCLRCRAVDSPPNEQAAKELQDKIKAGALPLPIDHPRCPDCGGILYIN